MSVLFVALPVAILLGAAAMVACVMCIRGGQYDDLETPAVRMLIEDKSRNITCDEGPDADLSQPSDVIAGSGSVPIAPFP